MTSAALRENFFKVAERVESLSGIIDPSNPQSLIYAQKVRTYEFLSFLDLVQDVLKVASPAEHIIRQSS